MLIRLTVDQISKNWEFIKGGINAALPPVVGQQSDRMSNILTALMTNMAVCWLSVEERADRKEITGFVITTLIADSISGTKSLLIFCVYGVGTAFMASWKEGLEILKVHAKEKECHRIIGYTDVSSIVEFVKMAGGEAKYTFISFPI
jgi:hypothetical protein